MKKHIAFVWKKSEKYNIIFSILVKIKDWALKFS